MFTQTSKRMSHAFTLEIFSSFDNQKINFISTNPRFQKKISGLECFKSIHTDTDLYSVPTPLQQFPYNLSLLFDMLLSNVLLSNVLFDTNSQFSMQAVHHQ